MLRPSRLKEKIHYNPDTGILTWISGRNAGQEAGWLEPHGYRRILIDGEKYYAHRLAYLYMNGSFPEHEIDHANQNRSDNKWPNLKATTKLENKRNNSLRANNTSGFNGVSLIKSSGKWRARIKLDSKDKELGSFLTKEDAIEARKAANIKHGYHINHAVNKTQYHGL